MRNINKGTEPNCFSRWKASTLNATFDSLSKANGVKSSVKQSLIREQLGLCCYCESKINSDNSHIEHLQSQQSSPQLQLTYSNLLASCQADGKAAHCGHKKSHDNISIDPLMANPEDNFLFAMDGQILPNPENNQAAIDTIRILGLDSERLKNMRKSVLSIFEDIASFSPEDLTSWRAYCTQPNNGQLPEFCSAMSYQLDQA